MDCSVGSTSPLCHGTAGAGPGGYTYGDMGNIIGGPEVHADGEIWGETLWDIRSALGSNVSEALITGGMRGSPTNPSFLDERNAILATDVALFGGHHQAALWRIFANRGMGNNASTFGANDTSPNEGFSTPPDQAPAGSLSATPNALAPGGSVHF